MRGRRVWIGALLAGVTVGVVFAAIVWRRERAVVGHFMAPQAFCRLYEYDHVAMLGAIDQTDRNAVDALFLLQRPGAESEPLHSEKITYLEAKREHLALLADLVTKYFRGGNVKNPQCFGDTFLNRDLYYPTFDAVEKEKRGASRQKDEDDIFGGYSLLRRFSWTTTAISLIGAVLSPFVTAFIFILSGRRERTRANQRIVLSRDLPK